MNENQMEKDLEPITYERYVVKQFTDPALDQHYVWDSFFGKRLKEALVSWADAGQVFEIVRLHIGHWAVVIDNPNENLKNSVEKDLGDWRDVEKVWWRTSGTKNCRTTIFLKQWDDVDQEHNLRTLTSWSRLNEISLDHWIGLNRLKNQTTEQLAAPGTEQSTNFVFRLKNGDYISIDMKTVSSIRRNPGSELSSPNLVYFTTTKYTMDFDMGSLAAAQKLVTDAIEFQAKIGRVGFVSTPDGTDEWLNNLVCPPEEHDRKHVQSRYDVI
jgi:hypothetical protein